MRILEILVPSWGFILGLLAGLFIMYQVVHMYIDITVCDKSFGIIYKKTSMVLICETHLKYYLLPRSG